MTTPPTEIYSPGLEAVVAGETAISTVTGGLRYRGYPVVELAEHATFDEVAHLLLHGELPTAKELKDFQKRLTTYQELPGPVSDLLKVLPKNAIPMDVVRTAVSLLSIYDPDVGDNTRSANLRKAERLLAQIPLIIAQFYRHGKGLAAAPPRPDLGFAANLLAMLQGAPPTPFAVKAFDVSLILYAEHEFNASTFTARVVVSTEADLHSAIVAAIGALKGPLHGGANERVMEVLLASGGPATAEAWVRGAIARKEKIMGFGHRVYKTGDVRARVLKDYAQQAAAQANLQKWEETAAVIEGVLEKEKNLYPNLDWPAGRLYHALGLEIALYTPFFVASRVTGWSAHVIEQLENNRIMRPRGRYTGPEERPVIPIADRKA